MLVSQVVVKLTFLSGDVRQADHVPVRFAAGDLPDEVRNLPEKLRTEMKRPLSGKDGHVEDLGFDKVLEDMAAVGQFRIVAGPVLGHLADGGEAAE